jgi:hypothetical protein
MAQTSGEHNFSACDLSLDSQPFRHHDATSIGRERQHEKQIQQTKTLTSSLLSKLVSKSRLKVKWWGLGFRNPRMLHAWLHDSEKRGAEQRRRKKRGNK